MSESEATSTSSPLNHYPPEQRGSLGFQRELNEMSGTTRHPIDPTTTVSEEAARNIEKIEEVMRSSSSSLHLYMDLTWSCEEYYRGGPEDSWRAKEPSKPEGGLLDWLYNRPTPRLLTKKEAEEKIAQLAAERALASHAKDAASAQDPISISSSPDSLGEAYYDLEAGSARAEGGAANDEDDDVMDFHRAAPEHFEDVEDITEEDIEEVTRDIDLCNYDYVPEESDIEAYEATPQPELEDVIEINGSPRILACRDMSSSLLEESLAELVEQYRLEGRVVLPRLHMRCYRFDHQENGGRIPRMVLSSMALKVGVASPLHPLHPRCLRGLSSGSHSRSIQTATEPWSLLYIIYYQARLSLSLMRTPWDIFFS